MICIANQTTVSMGNTTLGWNGLNKSKSFMTVIIKVNPIQIGLSRGLSKGCEGAYKKAYVGLKTFEKY